MKNEIVPFKFDDWNVRTVTIDGEPWVFARDAGDILGIANVREVVRRFPENEKGVTTADTPGGKQEMTILNEPGIYRLIFQSRKPDAERIKAWVFNEVLPQIRRTGSYAPEPARPAEALNAKAAAALNDLVGRATLCVNRLERENRWLREKDRMRREMENLRTRLAQKNTPLSKSEEARIVALSKSASVSQIARLMNRSVSAIRRALKRAKEAA